MSISEERKAQGYPGELATKQWLDNDPVIWKFIDVSKNPEYYMKDVDSIAKKFTGQIIHIESKTDTIGNKAGNLCIQLKKNYLDSDGSLEGWFFRSAADMITFYDKINQILYVFKFDQLRKWYLKNTDDLRIFTKEDKDNPSIVSDCALIPKLVVESISQKYHVLLPAEGYKFKKEVNNF